MKEKICEINQYQKNYQKQALVVLFLAMVVLLISFWTIPHLITLSVIVMMVGILVYFMIHELQLALQGRVESLLLNADYPAFSALRFDVGKGIDEHLLLAQKVVASGLSHECKNVCESDDFYFEESWFYHKISARFLPLTHTVFEGIIGAFSVPKEMMSGQAQIYKQKNELQVTGGLAHYLVEKQAVVLIERLMLLLGGQKATVVADGEQVYIWFYTHHSLYPTVPLFRPFQGQKFIQQVLCLKLAAEQLARAFSA
ncbi:MAG: hypothetical protein IJ864_00510 [Alphaproteobacteria bacterium]|nr:hypothetical protein [Alphaproteobacteria bacterium]